MSGPVTLAVASQKPARRAIQGTNLATASMCSLWRAIAERTLFLQKYDSSKVSPTISMQLVINMFYNIK
jgi:hypothetical protein